MNAISFHNKFHYNYMKLFYSMRGENMCIFN